MEKDIEILGQKIHYKESGNPMGVPVVLLHGWGCDHSTVAMIEQCLLPEMHVYSLDLPGHGKSDEPREVWGVEEYTRLTETFINVMGLSNPVMIGHSFGGRISILLSSRGKVRKVVLVDSAGVKPRRSVRYYVKVYSYKAARMLLPMLLGRKRGNAIIERMRARSGSEDYNRATPMMRMILSKCVNEDLCEVMPKIEAPTLMIWGENDTATPLSDARKMERLIPGSGVVAMEGCGHYSFLENPVMFRAVMREFLKEELRN